MDGTRSENMDKWRTRFSHSTRVLFEYGSRVWPLFVVSTRGKRWRRHDATNSMTDPRLLCRFVWHVAESVAFPINRSTKIEIRINIRSLIRSHCQDSQELKWSVRFSSVFLVRLTFAKKTSRDRIFYQIVSLAHWRTRPEVIVVWTMEFSPVENPPVRFIGRVQNIATQQFRALVSFLRHRRKENTHCLSVKIAVQIFIPRNCPVLRGNVQCYL